MTKNYKGKKLNREERRLKAKLEKEQIYYDDVTLEVCDAELEDGSSRKAYKINFGKCNLDDAMCIIKVFDCFIKYHMQLFDGALLDMKSKNNYIESFEYAFININDIDQYTFENMVCCLVKQTLCFIYDLD